ncbi:hypothetical protein [Ruminococcus flavefaciens]|uniref:hypothetical protein n=1 Tax=Ruminococcus flavefaciens TaxID=1265 RepID=UPI000315D8ED|nr:hypothetical protein [Ruminococcus flavefaciens]
MKKRVLTAAIAAMCFVGTAPVSAVPITGVAENLQEQTVLSENNDAITTTIAVTGTQPVTTITMPVVDDTVLNIRVVTVTIMDISGDNIVVKPVDGSPELKSSNKFSLSAKQLPANLNPKVGMKLEILYSGGINETYPAQFANVQKITVVSETANDKEAQKPLISEDDILELSKKGDELTWSDFEKYEFTDIGDGTNIWQFVIKNSGSKLLVIGRDLKEKPEHINCVWGNGAEFDIRTEDLTPWFYDGAITTTIAVTETKPVTTITMPVLDDPTIQTAVVTVTIMDLSGDNILVKPVDGSPELKSSSKFSLSAKKLPADITPKVGMKLEITYNGGILETYPAQFGNVKKVVEVKEDTVKEGATWLKGTKDMTLKDVMRLAELGDELDWADFKDYNGRDVGSGLHIWEYKLEDGYVLDVGGDVMKKPLYILLSHDNDKGIDIRTEDVKEYIASSATPVLENSDYSFDDILNMSVEELEKLFLEKGLTESNGVESWTKIMTKEQTEYYLRNGMLSVNIDPVKYMKIIKESNENKTEVKSADDIYMLFEDGPVEWDIDKIYSSLGLSPEQFDIKARASMTEFTKNEQDETVFRKYCQCIIKPVSDNRDEFITMFTAMLNYVQLNPDYVNRFFDPMGGGMLPAEIIKGDANCDSQVDLSDAVMIMQALANPNKYGIDGTAEHHLTEQGKLNGDMNGDGLTVGDAQSIQRKLLGLDKADSQSIDSSLIANKLFRYEKSADPGILDDLCDLSFGSNGQYFYHIGYYKSSNQDQGTWTISGDTVVLTGQYGTNKFRYEDKALVYIAEESDGFSEFNDKSTPKDGEKFILAEEPDYAAINNLSEIVTIKTDYNPIMSDWSGIGILLEFDSKDYSISLRTNDGHFTTWDIAKGSGPIKNAGVTYDIGNSGYIFWTPGGFEFDADYQNEIVIIGEKDGKSVKLGSIIVTPSNNHTLTAVLK